MYCTLMHRTYPVAELILDEYCIIRRVLSVIAPERLPVGVSIRHGAVDRAGLNEWLQDRCIPSERMGLSAALSALSVADRRQLIAFSCGFNLSDHYWLRPEGTTVSWEGNNFFDNAFSPALGEALLTGDVCSCTDDLFSPDSATDGNLCKRWEAKNGVLFLRKSGSPPYEQQPYAEAVAALLMDRLAIPHVPYTVDKYCGHPYSLCPLLTDSKTELVPAWRIWKTCKKPNDVSVYRHFVHCAETLGIPDVVHFLDRMIVLDYLIANEDRHMNNFGALRDSVSLSWIGMAPVYDSGTSLGWSLPAAVIRSGRTGECKPFKSRHMDQLSLVSSFDWIDFSALTGIREAVLSEFSPLPVGFDDGRVEAIADSICRRIDELRLFSERAGAHDSDAVSGDVLENEVAAYKNL